MKNLIGQKFGVLTVIKETSERYSNGEILWECQCDCGQRVVKRGFEIKQNRQTCGKNCNFRKTKTHKKRWNKSIHSNAKNLTNQRFGKLTAIKPTGERINNNIVWLCKCDCGNYHKVYAKLLLSGHVQSCGCLNSIGERNIQLILDSNNISYIKEYQVQIDNKSRRFDFAIMENNQIIRLIEFDGIQHTEDYISGYYTIEQCQEIKKRDMEKNEYAKHCNIPLVRLPYTIRDTMTLQDLIGDKYLI